MARLLRPYIPLAIRIKVLRRQLTTELGPDNLSVMAAILIEDIPLRFKVSGLVGMLAEAMTGDPMTPMDLDHDPALQNRRVVYVRSGRAKRLGLPLPLRYEPDANDPEFLVYRPKDGHRIKTLVRGDGAQLSDAAKARKNKRIARRLAGKKRRGPKMRSANRWPPKGSRKLNWRPR